MQGPTLSELRKLAEANQSQSVRRGWRAFKCEQCGAVFARPIANISSDALDKISWCMGCKDCFATFVRSLPDPELKVDAHGNLLNGGV